MLWVIPGRDRVGQAKGEQFSFNVSDPNLWFLTSFCRETGVLELTDKFFMDFIGVCDSLK